MGIISMMGNQILPAQNRLKRSDLVHLIISVIACSVTAYLLLTLTSITVTYVYGEMVALPIMILEFTNAIFYGGAFIACLSWQSVRIRNRIVLQHTLTLDIWLTMFIMDSIVLSILEQKPIFAHLFLLPFFLALIIPGFSRMFSGRKDGRNIISSRHRRKSRF
ncbi:MAG: hypothetical protein ACLFTR_03295 [Candidatus Woesearchaeota archaeon]